MGCIRTCIFCVVVILCSGVSSTKGDQFTPGYIYAPVNQAAGNAGILEFDSNLNFSREIPINAEQTTGSVFNDRGNPVSYTHLTLPTIYSV